MHKHATTATCPTCERTQRTSTCDTCEFATPATPMQAAYASATTPVTHRHCNDLPFSRRTFESDLARLLDANHNLFV